MSIPFEYVQSTCGLGTGPATCSFLLYAAEMEWTCAKGTPLEATLQQRREDGTINAMGDNCPGWDNR